MSDQLIQLAEIIGHKFTNIQLLDVALSHSSWTAENDNQTSNERLEFLGDAVLGFVVADIMYRKYPDFDEGKLTDLRKIVVNASALALVASGIGLGEFVKLGRGEQAAGGKDKTSILANSFEAVLGAVYLDSDAKCVYRLIEKLMEKSISQATAGLTVLDSKSQLQELCAKLSLDMPEYLISDQGPDHAKVFSATVLIGKQILGLGEGRSKKAAEEQAAQHAVFKLLAK